MCTHSLIPLFLFIQSRTTIALIVSRYIGKCWHAVWSLQQVRVLFASSFFFQNRALTFASRRKLFGGKSSNWEKWFCFSLKFPMQSGKSHAKIFFIVLNAFKKLVYIAEKRLDMMNNSNMTSTNWQSNRVFGSRIQREGERESERVEAAYREGLCRSWCNAYSQKNRLIRNCHYNAALARSHIPTHTQRRRRRRRHPYIQTVCASLAQAQKFQ